MIVGFVDVVSARERVEPWTVRCAYCGKRIHVGDSHPRIVDYCGLPCIADEIQAEGSAGLFDVVLNFSVRALVALLALGGFLMIVRHLAGPAAP